MFGSREDCEFRRVETSGNLAIVLTEGWVEDTLSAKYTGYLYIFDVSLPDDIERLYPGRIPLFGGFTWFMIGWVSLYGLLPLSFIVVITIVFVRFGKKQKEKKIKDELEAKERKN